MFLPQAKTAHCERFLLSEINNYRRRFAVFPFFFVAFRFVVFFAAFRAFFFAM